EQAPRVVADRGAWGAGHRAPGRPPVVGLRRPDRERLTRVQVPGRVVVAQLLDHRVELPDVAVQPQLVDVGVGQHAGPGGEAAHVPDERTGPQRLDQRRVRLARTQYPDQGLAAAQHVLQVLEDRG